MKRFVSLILLFMFCFSSSFALAEGATYTVDSTLTSDYSNDEVGLDMPKTKLPDIQLKEESQARYADDVVKQANVYSIATPSGLNITLNSSNLPSFLVLTQSYYASLDMYSRFASDADATAYINNLIDSDIHIVVMDAYDAFQYILVQNSGRSALTEHVGNLSALKQSDLEAVATQIAIDNDFTSFSLYSFNGNTWIQLGDYVLLTIVNSEFVLVDYYPNGDAMTDDDYDDYTRFIKALTLS